MLKREWLNHTSKTVVLALTLAIFLPFQNCSQVGFSQVGFSQDLNTVDDNNENQVLAAPPANQCTDFSTTTQQIKFLFMVDNSGSTKTTDPAKNIRSRSIANFLKNYGHNNNLSYLFGLFAYDTIFLNSSTEQNGGITIENGTSEEVHFSNSKYMSQALEEFSLMGQGGGTDYIDAMSAAEHAIKKDQHNKTGINYVVIFVSDGYPTDLGSTVDEASPKARDLVTKMIGRLMQQNPYNSVTLSTVYFCSSSLATPSDHCDAKTSDLLKGMALVGEGRFVNATKAEQIVLEDLVVIKKSDCEVDQ